MLSESHINWAQRLAERRTSTFVGRAAELRLFRAILRQRELPAQALLITGPPGTGKTTLLRIFGFECEAAGVPHIFVDAKTIQPFPDAFLRSLRLSLGLDATSTIPDALRPHHRFIIAIDNYERLYSLHDWLSETLFPQLPSSTVVVAASRKPPPDLWITDPAWRELVTTVHLGNFSPEETRAYLTLRRVPPSQHPRITRFSRGHPLALSLLADLYLQQSDDHTGTIVGPGAVPDVLQTLVHRFVGDVADSSHRSALEACAVLRVTTECALAHLLDKAEARAEFDWLCGLSFIDFSSVGIYPHELVREALTLDLKWRNPDRYQLLRRRALDYYTRRLNRTLSQDDGDVLEDYLYLHRDNQVLSPFFNQPSAESILPRCERAVSSDHPHMLSLVEQYEGESSARLLKRWLDVQPQGAWVVRGDADKVVAFMFIATLQAEKGIDPVEDPIAKEIWTYLHKRRMLQADGAATLMRFVVDAETYQDISPPIAAFAVTMIRHFLTVPNLNVSLNLLANPEAWDRFALSTGFFRRSHDLHFEIGGRKVGVFVQDWRQEPVEMWLTRLTSLDSSTGSLAQPPTTGALGGDSIDQASHDENTLAARRKQFVNDVRQALKQFHVLDTLASNPLADAAFVREACPPGADVEHRVQTLRRIISESIEYLGTSPSREKHYRALRYTFLEPQGSQERTAEVLDLPFSTYRGHLRAGIQALGELLWNKERDARDRDLGRTRSDV